MQASSHLIQVHKLLKNGQLLKARKKILQLYKSQPGDTQVVKTCVMVFAKTGDLKNAIFFAEKLWRQEPENFGYVTNLANWSLSLNKPKQAIKYYQDYTSRVSGNPGACFQLALLFQQELEYDSAVSMFKKAIDNNYKPLEECLLSLALMHGEFRHESLAIACLEKAHTINPVHPVIGLNLATLYQAEGRSDDAREAYLQIRKNMPAYSEALIRLIYLQKLDESGQGYINDAMKLVSHPNIPLIEKEGLNYALGKAHDDLGLYQLAFQYYREANQLQSTRIGKYNPADMRAYVDNRIKCTPKEWVGVPIDTSGFEPVFIVGHFRSGSSLVEQILSGHSAITALGEIDFFIRLEQEGGDATFYSPHSETEANLQAYAEAYQTLTSSMNDQPGRITDKRPENLLFMGLIKKLFPGAKFIHTRRNLIDNAVSIYFQQLNDLSRFSTSLEHFSEYDQQCQKLMAHWKEIFADSIYTISYEDMVSDPEKFSREIVSFLGLDWEPECMEFENRANFVRTASVSQVREKIHSRSVGRALNYLPYFTEDEKARFQDSI